MIVDQLFTPKPLREGGPYDLPGKDYDRPGDAPRKQSRGEHNPYPYSKEEDDDYFREIFRKKREAAAKDQGVAEKAGDLRPKLGTTRDKGKSVRKWRNERGLNEAMLMEDPVYRNFKQLGQYIAEQKLTEPEILQIFSNAEAGMTDKGTGANRTFLGRGKDTTMDFAGGVADALKTVWGDLQKSVPVAAVDVAYDQATDALANLTGGQKGAVMQAIKKYRNLAKQYPKTAGLSKAALVAIAGLATGGAGLPAVAALVYGLDSSIKGEKLSDIALKAGGAAATAWAAGKLFGGGATQPGTGGPADTSAFTNVNQMGDYTGEYVNMPDPSDQVSGLVAPSPELATYTVQQGDTLSQIAERFNTTVQELVGLNPQLSAASGATGGQGLNPDVIFPGQQITLPPGTPGADVYAGGVGTNANTMADIAKGQVPDSAITQGMAAKGQAAAGGNQFDLPTADAAQNAAADTKAAADYAAAGPAEKAEILKTTGMTADQLDKMAQQAGTAPIDYTKPGPESVDSLGQKLEYGMPVNDKGSFIPPNPALPPEELAKQTAAYNSWKADFMKRNPNTYINADGNPIQILTKPTLPAAVQESVKFKIIPASRLIDQKATVLNWALNESVGRKSHSVNLTAVGTYTVFENVERYRKALLEYAGQQPGRPELPDEYRPDMSGGAGVPSKPGLIGRGLNWLDKGVKKVGGALSNFGHQFTTNVTKEKLKMNWHQARKPSDSDQLAAWLVGQGVPQEVVTSVYGKMGIPYTAPAAEPTTQPAGQSASPAVSGKAEREMWGGNLLKDPDTGRSYTVDKIQRGLAPPAASAPNTAATNPDVAAAYNASLKAGKPASIPKSTVTPKTMGMRRTNVKKPTEPIAPTATNVTSTYGPGFNKTPAVDINAIQTKKPKKSSSDSFTPDEISKMHPFIQKQLSGIKEALTQPVTELLQMVETKEDVQRIKQFVDDTFVKYGAVNESAFALRNQILEHVTQVGAQRRREHSQRVAH
jgi:LysM repeat protein